MSRANCDYCEKFIENVYVCNEITKEQFHLDCYEKMKAAISLHASAKKRQSDELAKECFDRDFKALFLKYNDLKWRYEDHRGYPDNLVLPNKRIDIIIYE